MLTTRLRLCKCWKVSCACTAAFQEGEVGLLSLEWHWVFVILRVALNVVPGVALGVVYPWSDTEGLLSLKWHWMFSLEWHWVFVFPGVALGVFIPGMALGVFIPGVALSVVPGMALGGCDPWDGTGYW